MPSGPGRLLLATLACAFAWGAVRAEGDSQEFEFTAMELPPFEVQGVRVKAHTQGLWVGEQHVFVTARRDDVTPRRALLLRWRRGAASWESWDITPAVRWPGRRGVLDHPGGFDFDGERLWIPVAQTLRGGKTFIRSYESDRLQSGKAPQTASEFFVDDHIGAVAVSRERRLLLGASWDTRDVYVWNLDGQLKRRFTPGRLEQLGLGVAPLPRPRSGLAVQDWKIRGDWLIASGLYKTSAGRGAPPASRLYLFRLTERGLAGGVRLVDRLPLERLRGVEASREGMALRDGTLYVLPEDFRGVQRLWRAPIDKWLLR